MGAEYRPTQRELAEEMGQFLDQLPASVNLGNLKDWDYLYEFEAARMLILRDMLLGAGLKADADFTVLDFGYLHGLLPEFMHRFFPGASFTVCDRPESPIFLDRDYQKLIGSRGYLKLVPCNLQDVEKLETRPGVVILGEIIEHMDPTQVARALTSIRKAVEPGTILIVTTPNGAGLYNWYASVTGKDEAVAPPIPNPNHGYGHIHLWTEPVLNQTAQHCGWKSRESRFYHGREGEKFAKGKKQWGSLKGQIFLKSLKLACEKFPRLRGFFVASFVAQ